MWHFTWQHKTPDTWQRVFHKCLYLQQLWFEQGWNVCQPCLPSFIINMMKLQCRHQMPCALQWPMVKQQTPEHVILGAMANCIHGSAQHCFLLDSWSFTSSSLHLGIVAVFFYEIAKYNLIFLVWNFQAQFTQSYLENFLWNCPKLNVDEWTSMMLSTLVEVWCHWAPGQYLSQCCHIATPGLSQIRQTVNEQ